MNKQWIEDLSTPKTWTQASEQLCGAQSRIAEIARCLAQDPLDVGQLQSIKDYIAKVEIELPNRFGSLFSPVKVEPDKQIELRDQAIETLKRLRDAIQEAEGKQSTTNSNIAENTSLESATEVIAYADPDSPSALTRLKRFTSQAAISPILLINGRGHLSVGEARALVANLAIVPPPIDPKTLSSRLEHHHGFNGLTGYSIDRESGFGPAIELAWQVSGLDSSDNTRKGAYLWRIEQFTGQKDVAFERFHNRSCEAAFVCALWAAAGGIPGDKDRDFLIDDLDSAAAITAMLDRDNLKGADTALLAIDGFMDKLKAAAKAKLEVVVISKQQRLHVDKSIDKQQSKTDGELWQEWIERHPEISKQVQIEEVETIREAWEQLTVTGRYTRWQKAMTHEAWTQRYIEVDDDGKPIDITPAKAESKT